VVELRQHVPVAILHRLGDLLRPRARGDEDGHAAPLLLHVPHEAVAQEADGIGGVGYADVRGLVGIEGVRFDDGGGVQVLRVEGGIDGGAEPDEAAAGALGEGQAQLQLRAGLVDLVDDDDVRLVDHVVLQPPPRDPRGDDDDVPRRRLGRRLALAVHHADAQLLAHDGLGDGADRERLAGAGAGHDAEALAAAGQLADLVAVLAFDDGGHAGELHAQLDGLARRTRGRDDDHAPLGRAAGIAFAGRCAGYLDHAAPFLCWCGVWDPVLRRNNKPPAAQSTRRAEGQEAGQATPSGVDGGP
jgi:hypothetical protein